MTEFNQDILQRLLERLDKALERAGAKVTIRVIGGAALMTGYGRDRTTTDVDYERIEGPRGIIEELAKAIGAQERIRADWMNQDGLGAIPEKPDPDEREVFRGRALTVIAAGPRHLLAMKLAARRDKDSGDVTPRTTPRIDRTRGTPFDLRRRVRRKAQERTSRCQEVHR